MRNSKKVHYLGCKKHRKNLEPSCTVCCLISQQQINDYVIPPEDDYNYCDYCGEPMHSCTCSYFNDAT